nr:arginine--tRNA ligase [candidate division KSB1 bacterium]NIR72608.1 arginine--tRNA ligase [candidate division KSB1 bacterium]NIS23662.1 arginine--tRNA ligase [candidate division KSB1 bacterium]NIT70872.1 arginine--tRNA ligase [candidate division KSB1 bacterium]NIU24304.1 arginine--tRNA ligase [candidate division KSB1 bacterium]
MSNLDIREYLKEKILDAFKESGVFPSNHVEILLERPKNPEHGDLSTNVAMQLASELRKNPRSIATALLEHLELDTDAVAKTEIAGAGFINFHLSTEYFRNALRSILESGKDFGKSEWGNHQKVQLEFVSANPTGPLNIVSARAATVGDVLARLFTAVGFDMRTEYYVNDAGRQVRLLGMSVSSRYMGLLGKDEPFPEEGYQGDYIKDMARELVDEYGDKLATLDKEERWKRLTKLALERIIASQKEALTEFRVEFDNWFHESNLRAQNADRKVLDRLAEKGLLYERDGAKWFKSSQFGDEKDRVLVTKEGDLTYFLVDIAYHMDKYERGFEKLYDLWGPDHHGYIDRMKAALLALGYPEGSFEVNIIQQVNLLQQGELVKMSKRAGKIIEMKELLDEVGVDVARFFFLERRSQSPLDFDLDLAKNTTDENPVFYVQYAHARICNIIKYAEEQGSGFS